MKRLFDKTKEVPMSVFKAIWAQGGTVSFSSTSLGDKRDYLYVSKTTDGNEPYYTIAASNVKDYWDAGKHTTKTVPSIPDDWEEISITYANYPVFVTKVVARNNHDGTVQLFRA